MRECVRVCVRACVCLYMQVNLKACGTVFSAVIEGTPMCSTSAILVGSFPHTVQDYLTCLYHKSSSNTAHNQQFQKTNFAFHLKSRHRKKDLAVSNVAVSRLPVNGHQRTSACCVLR